MAYIHCHNCDFSQDDFWDFKIHKYSFGYFWGYNPVKCLFEDVREYLLRPQYIEYDQRWANEMGWSNNRPHSWRVFGTEVKRLYRRIKNMRFWNEKRWNEWRNYYGCKCPVCGEIALDID